MADTPTAERAAERADDQRPLPDRVTMPLLALVTREAVDADYVDAARRRATTDPHPTGRTPLRGAAVATAVFGLLIALAAVQTSRDADVQEASRTALVDRINEREAEVTGLEDRVGLLESQVDGLRSSAGRVRRAVAEATVRLRALQLSTGFVAVSGPALRLTVQDNPDGSADGRVRATDLRLLVNGLWEAGAEAIAINGRRLSAISAIVNSNIAIQVNGAPLSPPYVVTAIGDTDTLEADLLTTSTGVRFQSLAEQFGFEVDRQNEDEVMLPSAPDQQLRLRFAEETGTPDVGEGTP